MLTALEFLIGLLGMVFIACLCVILIICLILLIASCVIVIRNIWSDRKEIFLGECDEDEEYEDEY